MYLNNTRFYNFNVFDTLTLVITFKIFIFFLIKIILFLSLFSFNYTKNLKQYPEQIVIIQSFY